MYYDGVTSVISISFSCGTQLFTIQWRDPEPGWSAKHSIAPSQHHFRSKCRLPAYWKEQGTLPEIKPCGRYWERSYTRQRRTITHPGDVTVGVTLQEARPWWVINKPARGCDVIRATGPMLRTGELHLSRSARKHTQAHSEADLSAVRRPQRAENLETEVEYGVKWAENSWGLVLGVARLWNGSRVCTALAGVGWRDTVTSTNISQRAACGDDLKGSSQEKYHTV